MHSEQTWPLAWATPYESPTHNWHFSLPMAVQPHNRFDRESFHVAFGRYIDQYLILACFLEINLRSHRPTHLLTTSFPVLPQHPLHHTLIIVRLSKTQSIIYHDGKPRAITTCWTSLGLGPLTRKCGRPNILSAFLTLLGAKSVFLNEGRAKVLRQSWRPQISSNSRSKCGSRCF